MKVRIWIDECSGDEEIEDHPELDQMTEKERETVLNDLACDFRENHVGYGAEIIEE